MKNKSTIFLSILFSAATALFVIPIVTYFFSLLFYQQVELKLFYYRFDFDIINEPNRFTFLCLLFPVIVSVSIIELMVALLRKSTLSKMRFGLITSSLLLVGFSIIKIFYIAFQAALNGAETQINKSFLVLGIEFPINLFIIVLIIFMFFIYSNRVTRKIKEYIN